MVHEQLALVVHLVRSVKEQPVLQRVVWALHSGLTTTQKQQQQHHERIAYGLVGREAPSLTFSASSYICM
eukprot:55599-Eustigmatos_ZCMA.PRE.1